ncbi:conserved hypothetical protein [Coccidioides posadasii str. Silveira]|uniref:Uncharacterized protein n=1 Tax=Coccidioides posadasii (strain RMSCC 757 / Silveira) TaxID=443226 RepID=E9D0Z5_COCPS|nr:conserved hypothetical protein [Coccidioides posadasii str. Silveira]
MCLTWLGAPLHPNRASVARRQRQEWGAIQGKGAGWRARKNNAGPQVTRKEPEEPERVSESSTARWALFFLPLERNTGEAQRWSAVAALSSGPAARVAKPARRATPENLRTLLLCFEASKEARCVVVFRAF